MKVSVIIPNRNDTVMLAITVRSCADACAYLGVGNFEIIVVDNSDKDIYDIIRQPNISPLAMSEKFLRVLRQEFPSMHSARQTGLEAAKGEYVFMSDSHVLWSGRVVKDVVDFMDSYSKCDMAFSPIGWIDKPESHARSEITTNASDGVFGPWGKRFDKPMKVAWNFGFRAVRRKWFLDKCGGFGFFARERLSWGGGEFYVALRSWLFGSECWTVPTSPCYHIGPFNKHIARAANYTFRVYGGSGKGNQGIGILASFYALGGDVDGYEDAKRNRKAFEQYGVVLDRDWEEAKQLVGEDREFIQKNQLCTYEELLKRKPWAIDRDVYKKSYTVCENVLVREGARIGEGTFLEPNCIVGTNCTVGDNTTIGPGAILARKNIRRENNPCSVGSRCFIGANAVINPGVHICDDVIVGAGSVVVYDIVEPGTYVGSPARKVK